MEDNINNELFTFDLPKNQSSYIKVIGVGGGGGNAVNHMFKEGIEGVDFIVCNTDMKALNASPVPNKISLGNLGLGAGNKPERARIAAQNKADDIREAISHNTQMLFITAGMGGGTGTGAAPVIAEIAKSIDLEDEENKKILVVAIVTRPFSFEGSRRREQAEAGIEELRKHVDSIIVINNDKLRSFGDLPISKAFGMADDVLLTAAKGIAEIITENAYVNRDFQDVNTVMEHSGTALMGTGSGKGANRAHDAIEAATTSVLLDDSDIRGAKNVLLYFTYSSEHEMTMDEQAEITDYVLNKTDGTADIIWGAGPDESLGDELKVILIATGFEKNAQSEGNIIELKGDEPLTGLIRTPEEPQKDPEEMEIIHKVPEERIVIMEKQLAPQPPVQDPAPEGKNIIPFVDEDDFLSEPEASSAANPAHNTPNGIMPTPAIEEDIMVKDIHIVSPQPEQRIPTPQPVQQAPAPKPIQQVQAEPAPRTAPAGAADFRVKESAERIRIIHDLLRNNPNGADEVQRMTTAQISGNDMMFGGRHSSEREASSQAVRPDGSVVENMFLYNNPPD